MCGIAGYIGEKKLDQGQINKVLSKMKERGPDHQSCEEFAFGSNKLLFFHSRLSIIDLNSRANQPFSLEGRVLIFNGEIYNYVELRDKLEKKGHVFKTDSDTEVLLRYYLEYGEKCVEYFEGMWAFAIYDSQKEVIFLSRDRFGEKPLYLYEADNSFYFGSEIKYIKELFGRDIAVNTKQLLRYIVNGYKALYKYGETYYQNIFEVPAGSNIVINTSLKRQVKKYWIPKYNPVQMTTQEAVEGVQERLLESLRIRLRSDVPLAFCLSGGVDSATLASMAAKKFNYDVVTYTIIDQDERYNEYENVKATVDDIGCKANYIDLTYNNSIEQLKDLITYHDGPVATITYFVHSFLSKKISQDGHKVVISGTSADELFTGYYDHFNLHLYEVRNHPDFQKYLNNWKNGIGKHVRNPDLQNPFLYFENQNYRDHVYFNNDVFSSYLVEPFYEEFIEEKYCDSLLRNRMMNELFQEATPVILHEDDLNSMRYSIENRSPFLDSRLFDFAYSIPNELLIQNGFGKYILREAGKGYLNDKVRLDVQKKGFNASINSVFNLKDKQSIEYILDDGPLFKYFRKEKLEKVFLMDEIPNSYSKFIFNVINAKVFLEM